LKKEEVWRLLWLKFFFHKKMFWKSFEKWANLILSLYFWGKRFTTDCKWFNCLKHININVFIINDLYTYLPRSPGAQVFNSDPIFSFTTRRIASSMTSISISSAVEVTASTVKISATSTTSSVSIVSSFTSKFTSDSKN